MFGKKYTIDCPECKTISKKKYSKKELVKGLVFNCEHCNGVFRLVEIVKEEEK